MMHNEHDKHGKKCRRIDLNHRIKYVCNKKRRGWLVQRKDHNLVKQKDPYGKEVHCDPWVSINTRAQPYEDAIIRLCALAGGPYMTQDIS